MDEQVIPFSLEDGSEHDKIIAGSIRIGNGVLAIHVDGYGECGVEDGYGDVAYLELYDGRLRLISFVDINKEEPIIIDLEEAREDKRDS